MAVYGLSTYGKFILVGEGSEDFSPVRKAFVAITVVFGLLIKCREATVFWSLWTTGKRYYLVSLLFAVYMCNGLIHILHYADNIMRPVAYFEPRYLYRAYILSTMEITFFLNFPITLMGFLGITRFLSSLHKGQVNLMPRYYFLILCYIAGSLLTVGHYRYEPPSSFTLFVNFTIGGEGIAALLMTIIVIRLWCLNNEWYFRDSKQDYHYALLNYGKDKRSDDEDAESHVLNED